MAVEASEKLKATVLPQLLLDKPDSLCVRQVQPDALAHRPQEEGGVGGDGLLP